jgi:membrane-associated phospholipid phosphatase
VATGAHPLQRDPGADSGWRPHTAGVARAVVMIALAVAAFLASYLVFVRTGTGQRLDQVAIDHVGQAWRTRAAVANVLDWITSGLIVLVSGACVVIAAIRRRWLLAAGALVVVAGANITTQLLKKVVLSRPDFGYGMTNSFPSGHTTVVASLVLAVLLVAPRSSRWLVELAGSVCVAVIGVGTVVNSWHYPSDVIGGLLVALVWGLAVLAAISAVEPADPRRTPRSHPLALLVGLVIAAFIFVSFGVRPGGSTRDLIVIATTMSGLAVAGALTVGIFARMLDARSI